MATSTTTSAGQTQPTEEAEPDLARALLPQVGALSADTYDRWVHDSVAPRQSSKVNALLIEAGDGFARRWPESLRIFEARWLERLSHMPWWLIPLVWVPIISGLFVLSVLSLGLGAGAAAGWAALGFAIWTFDEYLLHRFAFHHQPKSAFGRKLHFLAHGIHHLDPWDKTRLVFPPVAGLVIAAGLFGILWIFLPLGPAVAAMSGLLSGYLTYDMTHYYTHHGKPRSRWGKFLKAWHLEHHHKRWRSMYGVSSPIWDLVFRTGRPKKS